MRDMHVLDLRDLKAELQEQRDHLERRIKRCNNLIAKKLHEEESKNVEPITSQSQICDQGNARR